MLLGHPIVEYIMLKKLSNLFIITNEDCCNRCIHCYNHYSTRKSLFMERHIFEKIIDEAKINNIDSLCLSGGECFLHPDIKYFLELIKESNIRLRIYTTGQLITDEIISLLKEMKLSPPSITVYSSNEKVHDTITQESGSWRQTIKGINLLRENNIPFQISVPLTKLNIDDYLETEIFCNDLGATSVGPNPFISYTVNHKFSNKDIVPSIEQIKQFALIYNTFAREQGFSILPKKEIKSLEYKINDYNEFGSLTINPNGDVVMGTLLPDIIFGNIMEQSLSDIWNCEKNLELSSMKLGDLDLCKDCEISYYCDPNIGDNWVANYDVKKCDTHLCDLYKVYYKTLEEIKEGDSVLDEINKLISIPKEKFICEHKNENSFILEFGVKKIQCYVLSNEIESEDFSFKLTLSEAEKKSECSFQKTSFLISGEICNTGHIKIIKEDLENKPIALEKKFEKSVSFSDALKAMGLICPENFEKNLKEFIKSSLEKN